MRSEINKRLELNKRLKQAVKDFESLPEWDKKFYREMEEK